MRRRIPPSALAALVLAALAALPAPALAGRTAPFTPRTLAGTYQGEWRNATFGTLGPISLVARSLNRNTVLTFRLDFGGNVFGCPDPPSGDARLTRGTGINRWNSGGFRLRRDTRAFGLTDLTYRHATRTLTGRGASPPCRPVIRWTISGRWVTSTLFRGTVRIDLGGGQRATTLIDARRR